MLKKERQAYIVRQLNLHNKVVSADLCDQMSVSEDTVRRDLQELSDAGRLLKVHGGALSLVFSEVQFSEAQVYSPQHKKIIAEKAIRLIKNGMFILTSGGTTIIEMARNLPADLRATFMSGSVPAVSAYLSHPGIDVVIIGDKVSHDSKLTVGPFAINQINGVNADLCFLGTNALDAGSGLTDNDWDVVQVKKAMIESSSKVVCLTISEKLNSTQPIKVCGLDRISYLITELDPDNALFLPYKNAGIIVL